MVTSLWFSFECLGGYLGSAGGGMAYDEIGFRNSTLIIIGIQVGLSIRWLHDDARPLLSDSGQRISPLPGDRFADTLTNHFTTGTLHVVCESAEHGH